MIFEVFHLLACAAVLTGAFYVPLNKRNANSLSEIPIYYKNVCKVEANKKGGDDVPEILKQANKCNGGGALVFDTEDYLIKSPLNLTGFENLDIYIAGNISLYDDPDYWQDKLLLIEYQNSSTAITIGGTNVNLYGLPGHVIDGKGQNWWNKFNNKKNQNFYRPILLVFDGLVNGVVDGLNLLNSPNWFNLIANSSGVAYTNTNIDVYTVNDNDFYNTDGWDSYRTSNLIVENATINNGDDCFSFKPNSTNIILNNLYCNGSHGISVGSIGQYYGVTDIVENVIVNNVTMSNADYGARLKTWAGRPANSSKTDAGGGLGYVRNVYFSDFTVENVGQSIYVTQCYSAGSLATCYEYPSSLVMSNVFFTNFNGTTSGKYDEAGTMVCSSPSVCYDFFTKHIDVVNKKNASDTFFICSNLGDSELSVSCVNSTSQGGLNNGL
ncbi:hypothetical protein DASC09_008010 [Saccharomycopsis crataegensis]|uniref:galacturonan 1,4-alpha-galacturonidase n=1 Tax=Saccharomycopsis crataegensis TaxID=43959 RepID=A0AAV5QFN3_9ASCO|nr:hypothetical protein DASC09_008010 [Saccharomycopsis crataegensis]